MLDQAAPKIKTEIDLQRYSLRKEIFDHQTEIEFFKILRDEILGTRFFALTQVPVPSLIEVRDQRKSGGMSHWGKISQLRVDYVICGIEDLKPKLVIELDGSSHTKQSRAARDEFLNQLFPSVGIAFMRIPVSKEYDKLAIAREIARHLGLRIVD